MSTLTIPKDDLRDFAALGDRACADIRKKLALIQAVLAGRPIEKQIKVVAARRNVKPGTLRDWFFKYQREGWRALWDKSKYPPSERASLPISFRDFCAELHVQFQRDQTGIAAHEELKKRFKRWENGDPESRIPGYFTPPPRQWWTQENLPAGWGYRNFMRLKPEDIQLRAARQGLGAASEYRLPVLTSRVGLKFGEIIQFDDQEYDVFVNFIGLNSRKMRPLGLDAVDVLSACSIGHGFKPTIWNQVTETKSKLKDSDMLWFAVHILTDIGYRDDIGSTWITEKGTTVIRKDFADRIAEATGNKIHIKTSGTRAGGDVTRIFDGPGGGNFKFKALLEGSRNMVRNRQSLYIGATGLSPDAAPEEAYHGLEKFNNLFLKVADRLTPERAARLISPLMEWHEFVRLAIELYGDIDARTEHELEGWRELEFTVNEWRSSVFIEDWQSSQSLLALPYNDQLAIAAQPGLMRTRLMSPLEVKQRHIRELTKVPEYALPILLGKEFAIRSRVGTKAPLFEVNDSEAFAGSIYFAAALGGTEPLRREQEFLLYVNPFNPARAVVCDLDNSYLGWVPFWDRPTMNDVERLHEQHGKASKLFAQETRDAVRFKASGIKAARDMHRANTDVITGKPVTREEKQKARAIAKISGASALVPHDEPSAEEFDALTAPALSAKGLL